MFENELLRHNRTESLSVCSTLQHLPSSAMICANSVFNDIHLFYRILVFEWGLYNQILIYDIQYCFNLMEIEYELKSP